MENYQRTGRKNKMSASILIILTAGMALLEACTKDLDAPLPAVSNGIRDSAGSIRTVLRNSSCTLFYQAFVKAGLDSSFGMYTILAPTDSAMMAAGLTSAAISNLSTDSLGKLVGYCVALGAYGDSVLANDSLTIQVPAIRQDISYGRQNAGFQKLLYQQYLYLWERGVLYVNGVPAAPGHSALRASNGWIYRVNHVPAGPTRNLWDIIRSRPELSLYVAANELVDSLGAAYNFFQATIDTTVFSTVAFGDPGNPNNIPLMSTLFAPTNTAFNRAGFNTVDDIRQYVLQFPPGYTTLSIPPYNTLNDFSPMDSVLKLHYLLTPGRSTLFYQDLLLAPFINNGSLNTNTWYVSQYQSYTLVTPFYPQFSGQGGTLSIQWSRNTAIPPDLVPFNSAGGFLATNGVLYETDQLFYPHN